MPALDCSHEATGETRQVCSHLLENSDDDYVKEFTGKGRTYRLLCIKCAKDAQAGTTPWRSVCEACFIRMDTGGSWDSTLGHPEVNEQPSRLAFTHRRVSIPTGDGISVFDPLLLVQPVADLPGNVWVGLTAGGQLVEMRIGGDTGAATLRPISELKPEDVDDTQSLTLICSSDGAFVCVTETFGNRGVVIERASARRTLRLTRDDYHSDVSPFPAAFVRQNSRSLLIHGTAWNRLDVSDPATGDLLTDRPSPTYKSGEPRPPHYLDYFHGRLTVSPNQEFVADDGWVWHPVGIIRAWSVRRWLEENPWESEDGASMQNIGQRDYFWGAPLCWVDGHTLAFWGYGDDANSLIPAAVLFDMVSGEERGWFPGPEVRTAEQMEGRSFLGKTMGGLFFDRYLFAVSEACGVSVWDVNAGACLHRDVTFAPTAYHPTTKEFLTILPDGAMQLSKLTGEETPEAAPR